MVHLCKVGTDDDQVKLKQFCNGLNAIDASLATGKGVLIYCRNGARRSACVCIGYVMAHYHVSFLDAYRHLVHVLSQLGFRVPG